MIHVYGILSVKGTFVQVHIKIKLKDILNLEKKSEYTHALYPSESASLVKCS
jgi:hypothetical protein